MPTTELVRRRDELRAGASDLRRVERELDIVVSQREQAERVAAASPEPPRPHRRSRRKGRDAEPAREQNPVAAQAADHARALAQREAELRSQLAERPDPAADRAATLNAIDDELARRHTNETRLVSLQPPPYLVAELGPIPERLSQRRTWQRAARRIEMYREDFGVHDAGHALGPQPRELRQRDAWQITRRDVDAARAELQHDRDAQRDPSRGVEHDLG